MTIGDDYDHRATDQCPSPPIYSIRRPDIARAITSCWISLVPSKIVWLTVLGFPGVTSCGAVRRDQVIRESTDSGSCHRFHPFLGRKLGIRPISAHFDFATSLPAGVESRDALVTTHSEVIARPTTLDLAVIFWPSVRLAELLGSFDHLLHRSESGCALVPVVEHVPRSEPTPTARRRRCIAGPLVRRDARHRRERRRAGLPPAAR